MSSTKVGQFVRHENFSSEEVLPRHVDVWLPPGYHESDERYSVIYMHDGQNLFHGHLSYSGVPWGVDHAAARLASEGRIRMPILVGIWNTGENRIKEYMPQKPVEAAPAAVSKNFADRFDGPPDSDAYLRFIVKELKPFIDSAYRTLPQREHTMMMGSSMGGVVTLYGVCEYPGVFSGAACLSPSWTIVGHPFVQYLRRSIPLPPASHKVYLDYGSEGDGAAYNAIQKEATQLFKAAGYRDQDSLISKHFPGAPHSEQAWGERIDEPLVFLLSHGT